MSPPAANSATASLGGEPVASQPPASGRTAFLPPADIPAGRLPRVQIAFALLAGLAIVGPQSFVELAGAGVGVCAVLMLPWAWRETLGVFRTRLALCVMAWAAWMLLSMLWTSEPRQGVHELGAFRWFYLGLGFWLIMSRRRWIVLALAAGFAIACLVQIGDWIGHTYGVRQLAWNHPPRPPNTPVRASGWWYQPAIGGTVLVAALGLHLPVAFMGKGLWRLLGIAGASLTIVGLALTGARGAWLAAAFLTALVAAWTIALQLRARAGSASWQSCARRLGLVALAGVAALALVWLAVGSTITQRVNAARADIARVIEEKDFNSDTGGRLLMNWWAIEIAMQHPIQGVGVGGYRHWVMDNLATRGIDPSTRRVIGQAHSTPLHLVATTGLVGLGLAAMTFLVALRGAMRPLSTAEDWGSYDAAPFFALLGMCLVSAFETLHVNAQTAAVTSFLIALCVWSRPGTPANAATRSAQAA